MKKPIIGITMGSVDSPKTGAKHVRHVMNRDYIDRIVEAGGAPVLLPPGTDPAPILPNLDGLLITGGNDLDSARWGEPLHPEADLEDPRRAALEHDILEKADPRMPVFGICYGCQLLNVHYGGSLVQHLPDVTGDDKHRGDPMQEYAVEPGSKLSVIVEGTTAQGRSSHHQAVKDVAPGLKVVARHADGTVEAVETDDNRWIVGVQWHPERSETPATEKLFNGLSPPQPDFKRRKPPAVPGKRCRGRAWPGRRRDRRAGPDRLYVHTPDGTVTALVAKSGDKTLVSVNGRQYRNRGCSQGQTSRSGPKIQVRSWHRCQGL